MTAMNAIEARRVENLGVIADEMLSALHAGEHIRTRALFTASLTENVPATAHQLLGGVKADGVLRHKIITMAKRRGSLFSNMGASRDPRVNVGQMNARRRVSRLNRWLPSAAAAAVFVAAIVISFMTQSGPGITPAQMGTAADRGIMDMEHAASGSSTPFFMPTMDAIPEYNSIFEFTPSGEPALLAVNGRFYQMLSVPLDLQASYIGIKHGDIMPLSDDISMADKIGVYSNVVHDGEIVYSVGSFSTRTMVTARVNGAMRVFQRVSYGGKALLGEEAFRGTIAVSNYVGALELSGVGALTVESNPEAVNSLMDILYNKPVPSPEGAAGPGNQSLKLHLNGGLTLQLLVSGDLIEACGTWYCPEFFSEFARYTQGE